MILFATRIYSPTNRKQSHDHYDDTTANDGRFSIIFAREEGWGVGREGGSVGEREDRMRFLMAIKKAAETTEKARKERAVTKMHEHVPCVGENARARVGYRESRSTSLRRRSKIRGIVCIG